MWEVISVRFILADGVVCFFVTLVQELFAFIAGAEMFASKAGEAEIFASKAGEAELFAPKADEVVVSGVP